MTHRKGNVSLLLAEGKKKIKKGAEQTASFFVVTQIEVD